MSRKTLCIGNYSKDTIDETFKPQLTSLIDVMTILLVFLIKSFSVEGNLITPSKDLVLPISISQKRPKKVCSVEITQNTILSDGKKITTIKSFEKNDSLLIPYLYEWMSMQKQLEQNSNSKSEVMIQADIGTPFNVVKRVMFTCSKAGFIDFSVLVMEKD